MSHILTSIFFPLLQKIVPKLLPVKDLKQLSVNNWEATDTDPQFILKSSLFKVLSGWITVTLKMRSENILAPKLYFNFGEGYLESRSILFSKLDSSTYEAELMLPKSPKSIRFDPIEELSTFSIDSFYIQSHSEILNITHQFFTIMKHDYKHNTDVFRIIKKSYARYKKNNQTAMLDKLYREYQECNNKKTIKRLPRREEKKQEENKNQFSAENINTLIEIQQFLNTKEDKSPSSRIIKEIVLPQIIHEFRNNYNKKSFKFSINYQNNKVPKTTIKVEEIIDVIIPIYKDIEVTKNCINSVLNSNNNSIYNLILINDKSPDDGMIEMLNTYKNYPQVTIVENSENLGFIKSVNKGMSLNHRDVILLNSDTIATDSWIDKLHKTAYSAYNIATVTPLSNSATILSYPKTLVDNEIPKGLTTDTINSICAKVNSNLTIDLPTAHGFCMFIKRQALHELGLFDHETFGKGYGEENDFSMRALSNGWRNVASCDTFIQHIGSVSFSESKDAFIIKNLNILNKLYPEYPMLINKFILNDSLRIARRNISLEIFKRFSSKYILFISHTLGGGTKVAVDELSDLLRKEGEEVLLLKFIDNKYHIKSYHYSFDLEYLSSEWDILIQDLIKLGVWHIHYHHTIEFKWNILLLPTLLNVKYDYTIHDYFSICPRINLINEKYEYCNEPSNDECNRCLKYNGVNSLVEKKFKLTENNIVNWRKKFLIFLQNSHYIYAPNQDVLERIEKYFTLNNIVLREHPSPKKTITLKEHKIGNKHLKVAILGAISYIKGFNRLYKCIQDADKKKLPIDFIIIGYTVNDDLIKNFSNVTITGKYEEKDLASLIKQYNCSISLFLNIWPETFSYTFSESLKSALYPIAYDIGAIAARMKKKNIGTILPLDSSAHYVNKKILEIFNKKEQIEIGKKYESIISNYYELKKLKDSEI